MKLMFLPSFVNLQYNRAQYLIFIMWSGVNGIVNVIYCIKPETENMKRNF